MIDSSNARAPRIRLKREERERLIVSQAIAFFAEVGLSGDTTALAASMGVAQPLIYRYFENKEALIARVFEETFLSNWNPSFSKRYARALLPLRAVSTILELSAPTSSGLMIS